MITAFQVILLIVIVLSLIGSFAGKDDKQLSQNMNLLCIFGIVAFFATVALL